MQKNGIDCVYIDIAEFIKNRNLTDIEIKEKCGMETKLYLPKYNMSFMTDGIIKYKSKYFIFEFKTETAEKFYKRTGVDEKHYNQAIAYSLAFQLSNILFIYENRNTLDKKAYIFEVTDEMKNNMIERLNYCNNCVKENQIPPKPNDTQKNICNYCEYKTVCKKYN